MAERVLVLGAGISGLFAALALSAAPGRECLVLERDEPPPDGSADEAFLNWQRSGARQVIHSHGFLALVRNAIRDRHPDLHAALLRSGVRERGFLDGLPEALRRDGRSQDERMTAFLCRRLTFEQVLYRHVRGLPGVTMRTGIRIVGLTTSSDGGIAQTTGVLVEHRGATERIAADAVVDAMGARSPALGWLKNLGIAVREDNASTGILYYTRFYRHLPDRTEPAGASASWFGDLGYLKYGIFPADNGVFSVTLVIPEIETDLRTVAREDSFERVCRALPAVARWIDPTQVEPITGVSAFGAVRNRYRHFATEGMPAIAGYFAVGDASMRTSPLYARGCALCFTHTDILAAVFDRVRDPIDRSRTFAEESRMQLYPYYLDTLRRDRIIAARARALKEPAAALGWRDRLALAVLERGIQPLSEVDIVVRRAFRREFHMLERPGSALRNAAVLSRLAAFMLRNWLTGASSPPPIGPDRAQMRQILGLQ